MDDKQKAKEEAFREYQNPKYREVWHSERATLEFGFDAGLAHAQRHWDRHRPVSPPTAEREGDAETLAIFLHTTYEHLAPQFGYETRKDTREFDSRSPNGMLMIATAKAILDQFFSPRLAEAEAVIDHYGDEKTFEYVDDITEPLNVFCIYKGELENIEYTTGQHVAREYRAKYPKGENL